MRNLDPFIVMMMLAGMGVGAWGTATMARDELPVEYVSIPVIFSAIFGWGLCVQFKEAAKRARDHEKLR